MTNRHLETCKITTKITGPILNWVNLDETGHSRDLLKQAKDWRLFFPFCGGLWEHSDARKRCLTWLRTL